MNLREDITDINLEEELTEALLDIYQRAGEEVGYWGRRFLQDVRRKGGLPTAQRMLRPRAPAQRGGLDAILEAGWPDLTVEAVVLRPEFRSLFIESVFSPNLVDGLHSDGSGHAAPDQKGHDFSVLTDEELAQLIEILRRADERERATNQQLREGSPN